MTDRVKGCTVVFSRDLRIDDVQPLLDAIGMLKYVRTVESVLLEGSTDWFARERVRSDLERQLIGVIRGVLRKPPGE